MNEETVRRVLEEHIDSPIEVGRYRGIDGLWVKIRLDPRIENTMRPTSLSLSGATVDEMKVRFVAATADRESVMEALADIEALTPADGEISAENHELSAADEFWPHIYYETLSLSEAADCLEIIEDEPLPTYRRPAEK